MTPNIERRHHADRWAKVWSYLELPDSTSVSSTVAIRRFVRAFLLHVGALVLAPLGLALFLESRRPIPPEVVSSES